MQSLNPRAALLLTLSVLLVIYFYFFLNVARSIEAEAFEAFETEASATSSEIARVLNKAKDSLLNVIALFASSNHVNELEFQQFIQESQFFQLNPNIRAIAIGPILESDQVETFNIALSGNSATRQALGYPEFSPVSLQSRDVAIPLALVESPGGREGIVGFDMASNEARLKTARQSINSGSIVMTPPVNLSQDPSDAYPSVLLIGSSEDAKIEYLTKPSIDFEPILIFAVSFTPSAAIDQIISSQGSRLFEANIVDVSDEKTIIFHGYAPNGNDPRRTDNFQFAGREWSIQYYPSDQIASGTPPWLIALFTSGLLLIIGLAWSINALIRIRESLKEQVAEQTQDLTISNRAAEEARERLEEAQRIAKVGGWYLDVNTNQMTWTEELYRMYEFDPALPVPSYSEHKKLFTPKSADLLMSSLAKMRETGVPYELELQTVRKDGSNGWMWVRGERLEDESGVTVGLQGVSMDITERKRADEKLKLSARIFESSLESIMITNAEKEIIDVNPAFSAITGYSREDIIGKKPEILSSGRQTPEFYEAMWQEVDKQGYWRGELWNRTKSGELYAESLTVSVLKNEQNEVTNYVGISTDITSSKQQQEKLNLMAYYDALTGLPNRTLFADRFSQAIAHNKRTDHKLAICFLDLDNFKPVNDNYGHDVGDQLLIEVAKRITASIREEDTVSRQGGDEFTLLLNDIHSYGQCQNSLNRILHAFSQPYLIDGTLHNITTSIGVTLYPDDDEDIDTLIRHADNAMYQAKLSGRNRYHFFDSKQDERLIQKHHKLGEIQQALNNNELSLYYQPKVNMVTGGVQGAEALIRWIHPEKGIIAPLDFLPLLDGTDLELQIGDWVINEALRQLDRWRAQGLKLEVSVNIASHHLQSQTFLGNLEAALARYPMVDPSCLQLEILESSALGDLNVISTIIKTCQDALGVNIALDDFGTGYSSLTHLRNLSANIIKIDQSFVRDMLDDPGDYNIIDGVIGLAESFDREVIAEGVETTAHGIMLLIMGCKEAQGYSIAKPMPANELPQWIRDYTPNQEWQEYGSKPHSVKEERLMLFRLVSEHWLAAFTTNIYAAPQDMKHWPIMKSKQDPCGHWIRRERKGTLFTSDRLDRLAEAHENVHIVAESVRHQYQQGHVDAAREALSEVQSAFDKVSGALELCK
ncbi:bifunctional diguanylate cyclase/phosphodiesterase [Marinobacter confluentis]|uniref:EAL domain-containing protein n=1 Tax=Marinobacter confluentis TaxID=1697557 RepID=A0A4Z1CFY3_9GAMM|nr:EAL domain-containing protein [Marinobacter confluentis]TGN39134.1 EAL domain-containing protein [Marinobacter confluentis]